MGTSLKFGWNKDAFMDINPVVPNRPPFGSTRAASNLKLVSHEIVFEMIFFQPGSVKSIPERHRQADRRTDGRHTVA